MRAKAMPPIPAGRAAALAALALAAALSGCIQVNIGPPAESGSSGTHAGHAAPLATAASEPDLEVDFAVTPEVPTAGRPARFQATVRGLGDRSIDTWHWEFGDGRSGEGPSVQHTYAEACPDQCFVELRVIASDGTIANAIEPVLVVNPR